MSKAHDREVTAILRILKILEELPDKEGIRRVLLYVLLRFGLQPDLLDVLRGPHVIEFPPRAPTAPTGGTAA